MVYISFYLSECRCAYIISFFIEILYSTSHHTNYEWCSVLNSFTFIEVIFDPSTSKNSRIPIICLEKLVHWNPRLIRKYDSNSELNTYCYNEAHEDAFSAWIIHLQPLRPHASWSANAWASFSSSDPFTLFAVLEKTRLERDLEWENTEIFHNYFIFSHEFTHFNFAIIRSIDSTFSCSVAVNIMSMYYFFLYSSYRNYEVFCNNSYLGVGNDIIHQQLVVVGIPQQLLQNLHCSQLSFLKKYLCIFATWCHHWKDWLIG